MKMIILQVISKCHTLHPSILLIRPPLLLSDRLPHLSLKIGSFPHQPIILCLLISLSFLTKAIHSLQAYLIGDGLMVPRTTISTHLIATPPFTQIWSLHLSPATTVLSLTVRGSATHTPKPSAILGRHDLFDWTSGRPWLLGDHT